METGAGTSGTTNNNITNPIRIGMNAEVHTPFQTFAGTCGVPARKTGSISLGIQTTTLMIGFVLVSLLFLHIGGYQKISTNSTKIVEVSIKIEPTITRSTTETTTEEDMMNETINVLNNGDEKFHLSSQNESNENGIKKSTIETTTMFLTSVDDEIANNETDISTDDNAEIFAVKRYVYHGPFVQIEDVTLRFGKRNLSLLSVLRCSCLLYLGISLIWFFTLFALIASVKYEIIDLVFVNVLVLAMITMFALIKAFLTGILIFYQDEIRWRMCVISFTVGGLLLCFIFNIIAFWFSIKWIHYINYMNGWNESCLCISMSVKCIKSKKRQNQRNATDGGGSAPANYTIPEATRHSNLPYIDDSPIQQFSNF